MPTNVIIVIKPPFTFPLSSLNLHDLHQVTSHLGNLVDRERAMTKLLNNGPEEHLDLMEKMQKGLKVAL